MCRQYGYYLNNSIQELEAAGRKPEAYLPYPDYNSESWSKRWHGQYFACDGPRQEPILDSEDDELIIRGYKTSAQNFPAETVGSATVLGLDMDTCFDRYSRYSPYGMSDDATGGKAKQIKWDRVKWGALQEACLEKNAGRYAVDARVLTSLRPSMAMQEGNDPFEEDKVRKKIGNYELRQYKSRIAILVRTWEGYDYKENDIQAIRALVTETSLLSGGEYQVFLFVNIKQREADIYSDDRTYKELLKQTVPAELRDMAILWTERVCEEWYPHVGDWQVYWQQFMPLQWFSKQHPEFDYIWNWETDARYTGNHYHFLEKISEFSKKTPRKHLWERNSRFYFPGSWDNYNAFLADTDEQILNASSMGLIDEPVWGPQPYAPFQYPLGPLPPTTADEDNFEWGVGEEADLITLQPIWDPSETEWSYRNHIWNFIPQVRPHFTAENGNADGFDHPGFPTIPRRVFINTVTRFSKKMLHVMHMENLQGRSMQAEMWPATVALQHGLKAVYAPHPIWTDRVWPAWYAEAVFNANDGIPARWGQQLDSPYNHDREANFGGWSWYYRSVFPHVLFRKWLGWKAHDWGWDADIAKDTEQRDKAQLAQKLGLDVKELQDLRMCLPGMLLHPVKNVYEGADGG